MNVGQLITQLLLMPHDAPVLHVWDGVARTEIKHVWKTKDGRVITADGGEVVYNDEDRPIGAPTSDDQPYWRFKEAS